MTFYQLGWLFFVYSFLGWLLEVLHGAIRHHRYRDRGVMMGPLCIVYGIAGCLLTFGLRDLAGNWLWLFLGCALYATVIEWVAGHLLERFSQTRWWDYSGQKFNLDGYICLSASLLWGVLGVVVVTWGTPLLLDLYFLIPLPVRVALIWVFVGLFLVDGLGTLLTIAGIRYKLPQLDAVRNQIATLTLRLGLWILARTEKHLTKAVPNADFARPKKEKAKVFAAGCSFHKLVMLFVIGAFLGDLTETLFCRFTLGYWMSRSSLVWGPFSIVWGLAIAAVTALLYRYKDRSAMWLFVAGTLLGGAYEYLCSVFTEIVFGTVFWDYSHMPFNLGGRINLLYCFFWGFASVAWFKVAYPLVSRLIEKIPLTPGKILSWCLVVFMAVDMLVSSAALARYNERLEGVPATNQIAVVLDEHFDNDFMHKVYPKAKRRNAEGVMQAVQTDAPKAP